MAAVTNAPSLKQVAIDRFDKLYNEGRLLYGATTPESIVDSGYTLSARLMDYVQFQFTLVEAFTQKPWDGKPSTVAKPDPFGKPEPDFVISSTSTHLLQLNKFNAWRPQFIIHPREYGSQKDLLTLEDFQATTQFLARLKEGSSKWLTFYNCCPESGSSQPYKHLQIVEKPSSDEFVLWPDRSTIKSQLSNTKSGSPTIPPQSTNIPYTCALAYIDQPSDAEKLHVVYNSLLSSLGKQLGHKITAHNFLMTSEWLLIVPRRQAGSPCAANSMGMLGIIWVCTEEEKQGWKDRGYAKHLQELAYPPVLARDGDS